MNELKTKLEELAKLKAIADKAEKEYEADCMNAEKEKAFDAAYEKEYKAFEEVAELIVKMTNRQIDIKTAREMVRIKRNEILNFIA